MMRRSPRSTPETECRPKFDTGDSDDSSTTYNINLGCIGKPLVYMASEAVVFLVLAIVIQAKTWQTCKHLCRNKKIIPQLSGQDTEDADVAAERVKVEAAPCATSLIEMRGLRKVWPARGSAGPKVAVANMTLAVPACECFGLLGTNGAGKTTTMSMLTGEVEPSSGQIHLAGTDALKHRQVVYEELGYCPQFDALFEKLSVEEHLNMYAQIRGIPSSSRDGMIRSLCFTMGLEEYRSKLAGSLSGGNKRKLCVSVSLIGDPSIVFLDEPSTGMDPVSRRKMWQIISSTMTNRSVILTTHSMEEAEALCSRIGVMVNGALVALGPAQHLKSVFGSGFSVTVRCGFADTSQLADLLMQRLPKGTSQGESASPAELNFIISPDDAVWHDGSSELHGLAALFGVLASIQQDVSEIETYSVSQTSLEQVFLGLAQHAEPSDE